MRREHSTSSDDPEHSGRIAQSLVRHIVYVPPLNFGVVIPGVYRSGYPNRKNFPFLHTLGLKSILYMDPEVYLPDNKAFVDEHNIKFFQFPIQRNKVSEIFVQQVLFNFTTKHLLFKRSPL